MIVTILASGQSLTQDDANYIRGKADLLIAVSNVGLDIAPWADALVAHDSNWWIAHPEAKEFKGEKISRTGVNRTRQHCVPVVGCNSGLFAMFVARDIYKATKIILLGFDMHGTHYFGAHKRKAFARELKNTDRNGFQRHIKQFDRFSGCEVYNCTSGSALKKFPFADLREII